VEIETTRFGRVEIDKDLMLTLPEGILGFDSLKRYIILDHFDGESPFKWLQSTEDPSLAFVITDPLLFVTDYKVKIPKEEVGSIGLTDADKALIVVIVNIKRDHSEITINLQGPVIINSEKKLAKQIVIRESGYSVRHVIFSRARDAMPVGGSSPLKREATPPPFSIVSS
jgi:flagellar assembly factor FliW